MLLLSGRAKASYSAKIALGFAREEARSINGGEMSKKAAKVSWSPLESTCGSDIRGMLAL